MTEVDLEREVVIPVDGGEVIGDLTVPPDASGMVLFAHGSGSSRHSGRNRLVAAALQRRGLATLLLDLLTPAEESVDLQTAEHRFDIELLADRLVAATSWLQEEAATGMLPIGCFGASTGGGAALVAAARRPEAIAAVVSRGGRPDLAGDALRAVEAPTLLIVGGADELVLRLNEQAAARLRAEHRIEVVAGATHLFEEPGALEEVAELAGQWFRQHLAAA